MTQDLRMEFITALNRYRLPGEKDIDFARRIKVPPTTLNSWKLGRSPTLFRAIDVAQNLGIEPGDLLALFKEPQRAGECSQ